VTASVQGTHDDMAGPTEQLRRPASASSSPTTFRQQAASPVTGGQKRGRLVQIEIGDEQAGVIVKPPHRTCSPSHRATVPHTF
jgi:hypothetical protein